MARRERFYEDNDRDADDGAVRLPDVNNTVVAVRAGTVAPRLAQPQVVKELLARANTRLHAERCAYRFIDDATKSSPTADEATVALVAWSIACVTLELLTQRVEKAIRSRPPQT